MEQVSHTIKIIGVVRSELKRLEDCPLQESEGAPEAWLEIAPEFAQGLEGLAAGREIILLTWFHLASRDVLKCYPRQQKDLPHVGVFTTRSPDRPNPIGLHQVTVKEITNAGRVRVFPLEALDGTLVIDIKPVIKS
jgi:tRNA-Thr(GGU) m(6)t(6)A37 methyltransferase TsaA